MEGLVLRRQRLHVDPPVGRDHEAHASLGGIDRQADIGFVYKINALFDAEPMNGPASHGRAAQPRNDVVRFFERSRPLNGAGLAAASGRDLRLDHERTCRRAV